MKAAWERTDTESWASTQADCSDPESDTEQQNCWKPSKSSIGLKTHTKSWLWPQNPLTCEPMKWSTATPHSPSPRAGGLAWITCICSGSPILAHVGTTRKADGRTEFIDLTSRVSDSSRSAVVPRVCISNKLPGDADGGPALWEPMLYGTRQVWDNSSPTGFFSQCYYTFKVNPLPWGGARQAMENEGIGWAQVYTHCVGDGSSDEPGKVRPQ